MEQQTGINLDLKKREALQIGVAIFILLIALTIGEYWIGSIAVTWGWILLIISLIKAFFIVRDYMHLPRLFKGSEESES